MDPTFLFEIQAFEMTPNQLPDDIDTIALPMRQKYLTIFNPEPEYIDNVIASVNNSDVPDVTITLPATPNPALKQSACADCIEEAKNLSVDPYVVDSPSIENAVNSLIDRSSNYVSLQNARCFVRKASLQK